LVFHQIKKLCETDGGKTANHAQQQIVRQTGGDIEVR
jgi:hypothetical protein